MLAGWLARQRMVWVANEMRLVAQQALDVVVASQEPDRGMAVEAGLAKDRVVLAHAGEDRVGVALEGAAV